MKKLSISFYLLLNFSFCIGQSLQSLQKNLPSLGYYPEWHYQSDFEESFFDSWKIDRKVDSLEFCLATDPDASEQVLKEIQSQLKQMHLYFQSKGIKQRSNLSQVKLIRKYFKKHFLMSYDKTSSFSEMFTRKRYNNSNASALYALVLNHYKIPFEIWNDATFIFLATYPSEDPYTLEPVDPTRFQYELPFSFKKDYLNYLSYTEFLPPSTLRRQGIDRTFYQYYFGSESLFFHQLIGMQYYQVGRLADSKGKWEEAISAYEKAFLLFPSLAIKFHLYNSHVKQMRALDMSEIEHIDLYLRIYNMSRTSKAAQEELVKNFERLTLKFLVEGKDPAYHSLIFQRFQEFLQRPSVRTQVQDIYHIEQGKLEAQQGNYEAALDHFAEVSISAIEETSANQLMLGYYAKNRLSQLEDCVSIRAFAKKYLRRYPFLQAQAEIKSKVQACE